MTVESPTVVRAFELPARSINAGDGWELLRDCWRRSTDLANWGVQQLLRADVVRLPSMEKLPPMPRVNGPRHKGLYGLATDTLGLKMYWAGACISAATILRAVERAYAAERLDVVWRRERQPRTYRYPHPWPVHAQGWLAAGLDLGKPFVTVALPGGHIRIDLRGGPEFGRQMDLFRRVVSGDLPRLQLVIRQQGASLGCHRPTATDRGHAVRVMVKMVARLPALEKKGGRSLVLATDPNAFWVAEIDGRPAWVLNNDHMRRGLAAHASHLSRLQRLAQDAKAGRRLDSGHDRDLRRRLEVLCDKHRRRMASWTHESAAHLVGFCQRQGVAEILYLDRDRDFLPRFPWHELTSKLADKCQAAGIALYSESGSGVMADEGDGVVPPPDLATNTGDEKWLRITRLREWAAGRVLASRRRSRSHPGVSAP